MSCKVHVFYIHICRKGFYWVLSEVFNSESKMTLKAQILHSVVVCSFTVKRLRYLAPSPGFGGRSLSNTSRSVLFATEIFPSICLLHNLLQIFTSLNRKRKRLQVLHSHQTSILVSVIQCAELV